MVNKVLYTILFVLCSLLGITQTIDVEYPSAVVANQQFTIEYTVTGSRITNYSISGNSSELNVLNPKSPSISNQSFTRIINGQRTASKTTTFSYSLKPLLKERVVNIPTFTVLVDGQTINSEPRELRIVPVSSVQNREKYIASLELSASSIFEGETTTAELKLYFSEEVNKVETDGIPPISGLFIKQLDVDGYEQGQALYNGKLYNYAILARYEIIGDTAKAYTFPAIEINAIKRVTEKGRGFFRTTRDIPNVVSTKPKTLKVLPLSGKKTESYLGVFDSLELSYSLPQANVNSEALELGLTLKGQGSFNTLITPNLTELKKHYNLFQPDEKKNLVNTEKGIKGEVAYTYTLVPKGTGEITSDSLALQYFNTRSEQFEYLIIPPFKVNITETDSANPIDFFDQDDIEFTPYSAENAISYSRPWFSLSRFLLALFLVAVGVAVYLLQRLLKKKKKIKASLLPEKTPLEQFNADITKINAEISSSESAGDLLQAIEDYVVNRFPVERANFNKESLYALLPEQEASKLEALLTELELGEYAGIAARRIKTEQGRKELVHEVETIIKQLENL